MPPNVPIEKLSAPAQPPCVKFDQWNPGATTPMNTSSSNTASSVIVSSNAAAICTPTMFSDMKMR